MVLQAVSGSLFGTNALKTEDTKYVFLISIFLFGIIENCYRK